MKMLMKKSYNLKEALHPYLQNYLEPYHQAFSFYFKTALNDLAPAGWQGLKTQIKFATWDEDNQTFVYDDYIADMLDEFYNRFYKYIAFSIYSDDELQEAQDEFLIRFLNVLNATYSKYKTIIKYFKNNESKLMDALDRSYTDLAGNTGASTNRFNDTPQNGGNYSDDNHTTNINQIESSASSNLRHNETYNNEYMIDRLNKIRDDLSNIFIRWENEVGRILWLEV